jgi:hypothetical protein
MDIQFAIQNHGFLQIRQDRAYFVWFDGVVYEYSHNQLAPGLKPDAWSLFSDAAYKAHCEAHGCQIHPVSYLKHANISSFVENCVEIRLLVHELVQTGGGGYRYQTRPKKPVFVRMLHDL